MNQTMRVPETKVKVEAVEIIDANKTAEAVRRAATLETRGVSDVKQSIMLENS
jgi:hypothetical protein